jgi:hypothetical protein
MVRVVKTKTVDRVEVTSRLVSYANGQPVTASALASTRAIAWLRETEQFLVARHLLGGPRT